MSIAKTKSNVRILFYSTLSVYSYAVLEHLLKNNIDISAIVLPGIEPSTLTPEKLIEIPHVAAPRHSTVELLGLKHNIRTIYTQDLEHPSLLSQINEFNTDFSLVACFPYKIPQSLCSTSTYGCLNLHPSLLPRYRGPTPVFWQLRNNEPLIGMTLHCIDNEFDTGDIVAQSGIKLTNGMRSRAIDMRLGEAGAKLFIEYINKQKTTLEKLSSAPQNHQQATYFSSPTDADFQLSLDWTATHAFNFMRGTDQWQRPYCITIDKKLLYLAAATAFSPNYPLTQTYTIENGIVSIKFKQGVLRASLSDINSNKNRDHKPILDIA